MQLQIPLAAQPVHHLSKLGLCYSPVHNLLELELCSLPAHNLLELELCSLPVHNLPELELYPQLYQPGISENSVGYSRLHPERERERSCRKIYKLLGKQSNKAEVGEEVMFMSRTEFKSKFHVPVLKPMLCSLCS